MPIKSVTFDANSAQKLLDLKIKWENLIRTRANARLGSQVRRELDAVYFKALPTIIELTIAIDDDQVSRLIQSASKLLNQNE